MNNAPLTIPERILVGAVSVVIIYAIATLLYYTLIKGWLFVGTKTPRFQGHLVTILRDEGVLSFELHFKSFAEAEQFLKEMKEKYLNKGVFPFEMFLDDKPIINN